MEVYMQEILDNDVDISTMRKKYQFKKKLGKGGFCDVFQATENATGKEVAIKMMQITESCSRISAGQRVARFRREMALFKELHHSNIVDIVESGETETGILYIVFEYIEGQTLAYLLKRHGALSVERTMAIMTQALEALTAAHKKGIIHRDLKPENIMVIQTESPERVKILDFGICTFIPGMWKNLTRLTQTQEFLDTPAYASPEQLRGEQVSVKTDLYSWGLIFLECLTGRSPFTSNTVAHIVQNQFSSTPVPIPLSIAQQDLGILLRWVLEKDHTRRAGSSEYVLTRLKNMSSTATIPQKGGFLADSSLLPQQESDEPVVIYDTITSLHERRQVTVLCIAVVINTVHEKTSLEVLDEIYNDLLNLCTEKVKQFDGYLAGDLGDRLMIYFGLPHASDSDPRKAVYAALELSALLSRKSSIYSSQHAFSLTHQIALHTGMITVRSRHIGKISGITPHFTAKLCNAAPASTILISEECFKQLKGCVECIPLKNRTILDSFPAQTIYRLIGERGIERRIVFPETAVTSLIGRNFELEMLIHNWKNVNSQKKGKAFCIQGEPGVGKSRLAAEFATKICNVYQGAWMACRCIPEKKNSAFFPMIEFIKTYLGLQNYQKEDNVTATELIEKKLKQYGMEPSQTMPLLCPWLGISDESFSALPYPPLKIKEMLLKDISALITNIAQEARSVIIIEDLHWIDPTSLELLPLLISNIQEQGLLLITTARSEFLQQWNHSAVETVNLAVLDNPDIEKLILATAGKSTIPQKMLIKMVERADGVPLFAEELALMFCEKCNDSDTVSSGESQECIVEIPATLRDLLTGRLDRLGEAKETAQFAAVLGRTFDYALLSKVSIRDEASLLADLDQLVSAGLIHVRLRAANPEYMFHHALVRDAAYDSLTLKAKEEIHRMVAQTIEREFGDIVKNQTEVLFRHWAGANNHEKASEYGLQATIQSFNKSLYPETIEIAQSAIDMTRHIQENQKKINQELELNQILYHALTATQGYGSQQVLERILCAESLVKELDSHCPIVFPVLWSMLLYRHVRGEYEEFDKAAEKAITFSGNNKTNNDLSAIYGLMGQSFFARGQFKESDNYFSLSQRHYNHDYGREDMKRYGHNTLLFSLAASSMLYCIQGQVEKAFDMLEQAFSLAHDRKSAFCTGLVMSYKLGIYHYLDQPEQTRHQAEELLAFSQKYEIPNWSILAMILKAWATNNLAEAEKWLAILYNMGLGQILSYWNFCIAQIEFTTGAYSACLKRLNQYITQAIKQKELFFLPELYRFKALCVMKNGDSVTEATETIDTSINYARNIGARLFEDRALKTKQALEKRV